MQTISIDVGTLEVYQEMLATTKRHPIIASFIVNFVLGWIFAGYNTLVLMPRADYASVWDGVTLEVGAFVSYIVFLVGGIFSLHKVRSDLAKRIANWVWNAIWIVMILANVVVFLDAHFRH